MHLASHQANLPDPGRRAGPRPVLVDRLGFERLLTDISATFVSVPIQHIDRAIQDSLKHVVEVLQIDRSTLNRVFPLSGRTEISHSFAAEGIPAVPLALWTREMSPWALSMALADRPIVFARLDELPPEAALDKEIMRSAGLRSHVTMPILVAGQLHGALSFGCVREERSWPDEMLGRLRLLAQLFGSALARKRAQDELDRAIGFERLASGILASLVLAKPGDEHLAIGCGLRDIGCFMRAEQVTLWRRPTDSVEFVDAQCWHQQGFETTGGLAGGARLPWLGARVAKGHVVRLARLGDLPVEAGHDAATLDGAGVRALLIVPISFSGRVAGALSVASIQHENEWPASLTPGVRLLADVFGSLHAREAAEQRKVAAEVEAAHWRERLAHLVRVHTAGEMSVALAHEITQPLGAIGNYALAARRRASQAQPEPDHVIALLDKLINQATRAGDVVARMRSMVQRHELTPTALNIGRAIRECVEMVTMDCDLRDIRIELLPADDLPRVTVDEIHLQQVLLNLLRNAMEAIDLAGAAGPRLICAGVVRHAHDEVRVDVSDSGTGIPEGQLERVFESFYSTKSNGLGIGLAICRKLIEAHGGRLWASHHAGGGAQFSFTIPVAAPAQ